jgi:hypothetical protein
MAQRFTTPVALVALLCLPALAAFAVEDPLKPADHEALGVKIAKYVAARTANKDIDKSQADLSAEMETLKKKLKGRDVLSLPVDLGKAFWQSFAYENVKGIKKGKINEIPFRRCNMVRKPRCNSRSGVRQNTTPRSPIHCSCASPRRV